MATRTRETRRDTAAQPVGQEANALTPQGAARVARFRESVRDSHYGGRDCFALVIQSWPGDGQPSEIPVTIFETFVSTNHGGFEAAARELLALAQRLDLTAHALPLCHGPESEPGYDDTAAPGDAQPTSRVSAQT